MDVAAIINRIEWNEKWNESEAKTKRPNTKAIDNAVVDVLDGDDDNTIKATKTKATRPTRTRAVKRRQKNAIISLNCKL